MPKYGVSNMRYPVNYVTRIHRFVYIVDLGLPAVLVENEARLVLEAIHGSTWSVVLWLIRWKVQDLIRTIGVEIDYFQHRIKSCGGPRGGCLFCQEETEDRLFKESES